MSDKRDIFNNRQMAATLKCLARNIALTCRKMGVDTKLTATIHVSDIGMSVTWGGCNCPECTQNAVTALASALGADIASVEPSSPEKQVH